MQIDEKVERIIPKPPLRNYSTDIFDKLRITLYWRLYSKFILTYWRGL